MFNKNTADSRQTIKRETKLDGHDSDRDAEMQMSDKRDRRRKQFFFCVSRKWQIATSWQRASMKKGPEHRNAE